MKARNIRRRQARRYVYRVGRRWRIVDVKLSPAAMTRTIGIITPREMRATPLCGWCDAFSHMGADCPKGRRITAWWMSQRV